MAYGDFKHSPGRTASDKVFRVKAFNIAKNLKYDGYQSGLASMVYKCFSKRFSARCANKFVGIHVKSEIMLRQE